MFTFFSIRREIVNFLAEYTKRTQLFVSRFANFLHTKKQKITQYPLVALCVKRFQKMDPLFRYVVFFPTLIALLYFGLIASPVYISESSFVVYDAKENMSVGGLSGLLKTFGGSYSTNASETINAYLSSWDAMSSLNTAVNLREVFGSHTIDFIDRFGGLLYPYKSDVKLLRYYQGMVVDEIDPLTGISKLTVKAYSAPDAQKMNQILLTKSQEVVNQLNATARREAVSYAETDVIEARKALWDADTDLAAYRNGHDVINPLGQSQLQLSMVSKLQDELIKDKVQLHAIQAHAPQNPNIPVLQSNIAALEKEISQTNSGVAGNKESLASKDTEYERLAVNQVIAQRLLEAAVTSLEQARIAAQKQELYLETISQPNLPDVAQYPKRIQGIIATLLITLMIWGILTILIGGIKEHHDH